MLTLYEKSLVMTDPNSELIVVLKANINKLIARYKGLEAEVKLLNEEKGRLTEQLELVNNDYTNLEQRFNNLKLTKDLVTGNSETGETKKRINQIVREIDKCIALLNR